VPEKLFVPADFDVPNGLVTDAFRLEPLGPEHNERDYAAWTSSVDHIRATPGFERGWPREMTLDENRSDLERHAEDFRLRRGFTYTVLDPDGGDVIGCVYIYPARDDDHDARVYSWVRSDHAPLDAQVRKTVAEWLATAWPFRSVGYDAAD
jgi:hypothetical protein